MKRDKFADFVAAFDFRGLFNNLGWDNFNETLPVEAGGQQFTLTGFAEKKGFPLFECCAEAMPERRVMQLVERKFCRTHANHIIIWTDSAKTRQVWQIPVFEPNKPKRCVYPEWRAGQSPEALYQRFGGIAFSLEDEDVLTLFDVVAAVGESAKNAEAVTKKFYNEFTKQHEKFMTYISGIDDAKKDKDNTSKQWYASLMLNRLMFCYFIQKKGFLDGNKNYLKYKFDECQKLKGKSNFYNFYTSFLRELFHDALAKPAAQRKKNPVVPFGKIPYLNGGLFEIHSLEREYQEIDIADEAFANIFKFFDDWNWHLDTRSCATGRDINPDVIGYIFEKYINDRAAMGAYYTKEDITEYIGKNTIIPFLLDKVKDALPEMFEEGGGFWQYLQDSGDEYIYEAVKKGICPRIARMDANSVGDLDIPDNIRIGLDVARPDLLERRKDWNTQTPAEFGLPTEIWRETIARWQRYFDLKAKIAGGKIHEISNLITYNLDIRRLVQDFLVQTGSPKFIRAFFKALAGDGQNYALTVLDPTCGSGAFLFAALNILEPLYEVCVDRMEAFIAEKPGSGDAKDFAQRLERLNIGSHTNRRYFIYKSIILNNLFGVDIMREAAETAKLRLFLKLVAVVDPDPRDANFGLEPLPDIDFNIKCGNTLVGFANEDQLYTIIKEYEGELVYKEKLAELQESCGMVAASFAHFQQKQLIANDNTHGKEKVALQEKLAALNDTLNRYLARTYGVNIESKSTGKADYKKFMESHQPFHWYAEFYRIIAQHGGFDVVIGNPPYVAMNKIDYKLNYGDYKSGDLYGYVIKRCFALLAAHSRYGFIVMHNLAFSDSFAATRAVIKQNAAAAWFSFYARIPAGLFSGDVRVRNCIFVLEKNDAPNEKRFYTTRIHRWTSEERERLFSKLRYSDFSFDDAIPMFANPTLSRFFAGAKGSPLSEYEQKHSKHKLYFKQSAYNWVAVSRKPAPCYNGKGKAIPQTMVGDISFQTPEICDYSLLLLNGKLAFSHWLAYGDEFHVTKNGLLTIKAPFDTLTTADKETLARLAKKFEAGLEAAVQYKLNAGKKVGTYNTSKLWPITDQSDRIFLRHLCDNPDAVFAAVEAHLSQTIMTGRGELEGEE